MSLFARKRRESPADAELVSGHYVTDAPSAQTAVDAVPGWSTALPAHLGVTAGRLPLFNDPRIKWLSERAGDLTQADLVELGPLDGAHTYMLHQLGPRRIDAIEANRQAFLRCLVTKELLALDRARFHLGDFSKWLEARSTPADLIVASGVLYHSSDPVRLLERLAAQTPRLYLWTHAIDHQAMPAGDPRWGAFSSGTEERTTAGIVLRLYPRSYHGASADETFCGGPHDLHRWMERDQIIALLGALGYGHIETAHEQMDGANGPSLSIYAERG